MASEDNKAVREYLDQYIVAHAKEHELMAMALVLAREVQDKGLATAMEAMNSRLASMNEFRAQLTDAQATYTTRNDLKVLGEKYDGKIDGLQKLVYMAVGVVLFIGMFSSLIV